jgi:hypothetical protein
VRGQPAGARLLAEETDVSKPLSAGVLCVCLLTTTPAAASFIEIGDAGDLPATANMTGGVGPLTTILGNLTAADPFDAVLDVDMFGIYISDPAAFSASTVAAVGMNVDDPQLFLFTSTGVGVLMNDDDPSGMSGAQSAIGALPLGFLAGLYFLAIGWWDNEPVSALFDLIFDATTSLPAVSDPVAGWNLDVLLRIDVPTAYEIDLTGALPSTAIPEPALMTMALVGAAALLRRQRARRRKTSLERSARSTQI